MLSETDNFTSAYKKRFGIASSPIRNAIENNYPELDAVYDRHYAGEIAEDKVMDALIAKAETLPDGEGSLDDFAALIRNTNRADFFGFDAFERQFTAVASFDITGFYRDVEGQLQLQRQDVSANAQNANAYNFLQNGDFATTKGLEFVFKLRRVKRLRTEFNYTLSDARGTRSSRPAAVRPTGSYTKPSTWATGSTTGSPKAAIFSAVRARFAWGSSWTSSGWEKREGDRVRRAARANRKPQDGAGGHGDRKPTNFCQITTQLFLLQSRHPTSVRFSQADAVPPR